ncbi:MAG: hypothetical protein CL773_02205, partial [Chloroflexi bacterium]|nr:hypothetical protein [Chloroflexota bacterium]
LETSDKNVANEELLNSISNPQNIPLEFVNITEDFSSDQINNIKNLTERFSIEQIIELEKRIVRDNFERLDFTDIEIDKEDEDFLSGSISVKKKYEDLNTEYELLLSEYSKIVENVKEIEKENSTSQSKTVSLAIENQSLNNKIQEFKTKISDLNDEKVTILEENDRSISDLKYDHDNQISKLNDDLDNMILEVKNIRESYKTGNSILDTTVRTGQSANFKFNWVELDKKSENDSRYLRIDLNNLSDTNPYNFRLMNYLPTGSMIPLLTDDTLGLVSKTNEDQEFFVGDVVSYVPTKFDASPGDMEGCDISLEFILKKNYNHISHRIIDKRWDEELEEWKYLPKGDQNALHDGCFITSKEIKYKLEMLIKIQN